MYIFLHVGKKKQEGCSDFEAIQCFFLEITSRKDLLTSEEGATAALLRASPGSAAGNAPFWDLHSFPPCKSALKSRTWGQGRASAGVLPQGRVQICEVTFIHSVHRDWCGTSWVLAVKLTKNKLFFLWHGSAYACICSVVAYKQIFG